MNTVSTPNLDIRAGSEVEDRPTTQQGEKPLPPVTDLNWKIVVPQANPH